MYAIDLKSTISRKMCGERQRRTELLRRMVYLNESMLCWRKRLLLSPPELAHIHGYLFKGILPHAGLFAHIISLESVRFLMVIMIEYANAGNLMDLMTFDFSGEKKF